MWNLCGLCLAPGEKRQLLLPTGVEGYALPVTLICGNQPGKTLLVAAGTHPDEYPGIAALTRLAQEVNPAQVCGNLLLIHCLNPGGFRHKRRTLPEDGFNLNGDFPGSPEGTPGQRLAHFVQAELYPRVDFILDLHSGSPMEPLEECIFVPTHAAVRASALAAARSLSVPRLLDSSATRGLYSHAANRYGVPGLLLERGHSGLCRPEWVEADVQDLYRLLHHLGLYPPVVPPATGKKTLYTQVVYLESDRQGLWYPAVEEGMALRRGQPLGHLEDFFGNTLAEFTAQADGHVCYYTASLSVSPGDSLVAYGINTGKITL